MCRPHRPIRNAPGGRSFLAYAGSTMCVTAQATLCWIVVISSPDAITSVQVPSIFAVLTDQRVQSSKAALTCQGVLQAVEAGRVDVTQKLIDFNAALLVHDVNGSNTPLHIAVKIKVWHATPLTVLTQMADSEFHSVMLCQHGCQSSCNLIFARH